MTLFKSIECLVVPILFLVVLLTAQVSYAQSAFRVTIKDEATKEPIAGVTVTVKDTEISAITDAQGVAELSNIPEGAQVITIFFPGYEAKELKFTFPRIEQNETVIFIKVTNEVGEVTVTSTRTGREIDDVPTRVEAIDEEEVDEKTNMRPANVSMVLNESTGIKVQQTSATSNTQSVRIQGLDGRYTQILKDGFSAFGGFSGSISLLDILPLDLKQVEIIKGPSATFYGGGAIAGVVNFISTSRITIRCATSRPCNLRKTSREEVASLPNRVWLSSDASSKFQIMCLKGTSLTLTRTFPTPERSTITRWFSALTQCLINLERAAVYSRETK